MAAKASMLKQAWLTHPDLVITFVMTGVGTIFTGGVLAYLTSDRKKYKLNQYRDYYTVIRQEDMIQDETKWDIYTPQPPPPEELPIMDEGRQCTKMPKFKPAVLETESAPSAE